MRKIFKRVNRLNIIFRKIFFKLGIFRIFIYVIANFHDQIFINEVRNISIANTFLDNQPIILIISFLLWIIYAKQQVVSKQICSGQWFSGSVDTFKDNLWRFRARVTDLDQYIGDFKKYLKEAGAKDIEVTDLTENIMPNLKRLAKISRLYYTHPLLLRVLKTVLAEDVTINSIAGFLMDLTLDGKNIHAYYRVTAKK